MSTTSTAVQTDVVARLMRLWATPPADDAAVLAEIRALYTDPVEINGASTAATELLARVRAMQSSYSGLRHQLLERVDAPGRLVVAFRLTGTHTGPLPTPLGVVTAAGGPVDVRVIDVLTLSEGRISKVVMVADELGLLTGLGAVTLA